MTAKRRIKKFNFKDEGAAVSLVDKAANLQTVLVMKAENDTTINPFEYESTALTKALEQVTVKMSFEEFLKRFFYLYEEAAESLAKILGFTTEDEYEEAKEMDNMDMEDYRGYLDNKVSSIDIMKSLHSGEVEEITVSDFIDIVKFQSTIEDRLDNNFNEEIMPENNKDKGVVQIEKAELDLLKKALEDLKEIKKQNDLLIKEREEAIEKSLRAKMGEFSFIERQEDMTKLVKQMDEDAQNLVFEVLEKASKAIEESVSNMVADEEEIDLNVSNIEKSKLSLRSKIEAQYKLSDK